MSTVLGRVEKQSPFIYSLDVNPVFDCFATGGAGELK